MAKAGELTEKQKIYNESNFPLIRLYLDSFMAGAQSFCDEDQAGFKAHTAILRKAAASISQQFNIEMDSVCRFANSYQEQTFLLNGIFTRKEYDHLYFIKGGNFIKIGRTGNPKIRLGTLQVSSVDKLEYIKIFNYRGCYEFKIHDIFDYLRVKGEWFKDHPDIRGYINLLSSRNSDLSAKYGI
jgi:hypothetical protein